VELDVVYRRDFLARGGALGALVFAGCSSHEGAGTATTTPSRSPTPTATSSPTATAAGTRTQTPTPHGTVATAEDPRVTVADESFTPRRLHVAPGTTVTWENAGADTHTVQSDVFNAEIATDWSYYSLDLVSGSTASYTFDDSGVFEYYCTVHGQDAMCGVVLVGDVDYSATLPCEG
jgi:plastocyanin